MYIYPSIALFIHAPAAPALHPPALWKAPQRQTSGWPTAPPCWMAPNCSGGGRTQTGSVSIKMCLLLRFTQRDANSVVQVHLWRLCQKFGLSCERRLQSLKAQARPPSLNLLLRQEAGLAWTERRRCAGPSSPWCPSSGWPGGPAPSSSWPARWCPPPPSLWSPDGRCWPAGGSSEMGSLFVWFLSIP